MLYANSIPYMHTYIHTYKDAYIHTSIHTYKHTYIHILRFACVFLLVDVGEKEWNIQVYQKFFLVSGDVTWTSATFIHTFIHTYIHVRTYSNVDSWLWLCDVSTETNFDIEIFSVISTYSHAHDCSQHGLRYLLPLLRRLRTATYIHTYIHTYSIYIHTYIHTYIQYIHRYIHTVHTYIHIYIHTYIHTYIYIHTVHTYINAYIHIIHTYLSYITYIQMNINPLKTYIVIHAY